MGLEKVVNYIIPLSFFDLMGEDVRNFYFGIAKQPIDHAKEWEKNDGSACVLSSREIKRLQELPRVPVEQSPR